MLRLPVIDCVFLRRLNRFVGEVLLGNERVLVHITNTGRLEEFLVKGRKCKIIKINGNKLKYRLVGVEDRGEYAVIDTRIQSLAFETAVNRGSLCFFHNCRVTAREPRIDRGRLDYVLTCPNGKILVETKSAVLRGPNNEAMYPDCPSARGVRHVEELIKLHKAGENVAIVFIGAFPGARCFKPYREGDPQLYKVLTNALIQGLEIHALSISMNKFGIIYIEKPCLPICNDWLNKN